MEIRTCEEYVVAELQEAKEQLEMCKDLLEQQTLECNHLKDSLKKLLSMTKLHESNGELMCGDYYRLEVDEFNYMNTPNDDFKMVKELIEKYMGE